MLARVLAMTMCPSVCLLQVGILSKQLKESSWLWHGSFLSPAAHRVERKFWYNRNFFIANSGFATVYRAVIPVAGQRTYGTTFRALEVTSQVTTPGAESAVYDCLVTAVCV